MKARTIRLPLSAIVSAGEAQRVAAINAAGRRRDCSPGRSRAGCCPAPSRPAGCRHHCLQPDALSRRSFAQISQSQFPCIRRGPKEFPLPLATSVPFSAPNPPPSLACTRRLCRDILRQAVRRLAVRGRSIVKHNRTPTGRQNKLQLDMIESCWHRSKHR